MNGHSRNDALYCILTCVASGNNGKLAALSLSLQTLMSICKLDTPHDEHTSEHLL